MKPDYREFKDSRGSGVPLAIKQLINCINTLTVSTAECERGFSKMNIICTSLRSKLTVVHLSSLMFVSLCGPPLSRWQPLRAVKSWIMSSRRTATSARGPCRNTNSCDADGAVISLWDAMK